MGIRYTGEKPEKEVFQVFNETMDELIRQDSRVVYLDADLMGAIKTYALWDKYPQNVFNMGIQEANMVGVACGMYLNGLIPYIHSFAPFVSRRVFDQICVSIAYAHKSVRVIGSEPGIMATHNGGTHMCFEDIAMMQSVPGACVVDVSDPVMCGAFLKLTKKRAGMTYIRMPRRNIPDIYDQNEKFEEGKAKILREGEQVTLIGSGIMVATCIQAAEILSKEGISARVIDIVTVKPIDQDIIIESAKKTGAIVTAENANIIGGFGSRVAAILAENYPIKMKCIGIEDQFGRIGEETFLREQYGLTAENIANAARGVIS